MGKGIIILLQAVLVCLYCTGLPAQVAVTPGQLLTGQQNEVQSATAARYFDDLLAARARWPWVDKFEFRTETDRLTTSRQEFLFRTSFLGFSRRKFEFLRHRALAETKVADYRQDTYDDFFDRCTFVVSLIKNQAAYDRMAERIHFHRQLDSLFRTQMAAGGETDLRDFLRNREEWLEAEQKAEALRVYRQHMLVKEGYDSLAYLNTDSLIRAEDIIRIVENLNLDENMHPDLAEIASESRYLDSELDVERAKDRKILDFAQVRYTTREDLLFENRFSVGVGINIPWSGASRLRHEDIRVKQEENQFDKANRTASLERDLQDKKAEAKALYSTYILYSRHTTDKDWQNTRTLIEQSGRIDPADIFRLKIYDLERAEKAGDTYADLLHVYVEALYYAGRLDGERIFER